MKKNNTAPQTSSSQDQRRFTGINRLFRSGALQTMLDKAADGTFSEFVDDWKWIFSFSRRYKGVVLLYTFLGIVSSTLSIASAYVSRILINIITGKQVDRLWLLIVLMLASTFFSLAFSSIMNRFSARVSVDVNNDIQAGIFDQVMNARWSELNRFEKGDLLNRFNNDITTISTNAISWIPNLIINFYTFLATFVILYRLDPAMAWIAMISAPVLMLMSRYVMKKLREYRQKVLQLNSRMMSFESETFYNIDSIKSFGITDLYTGQLKDWQKSYKEYNLEYNWFEIKTRIAMTVISTVINMAAFGYCLYRLWTGQILYGDMTFFLTQRSSLSGRFNNLISTLPGMLNSAVSAHRIRELSDLEKENHQPEQLSEMLGKSQNGIILRMKNASFAYQEQDSVYEHADFEAKPNEISAILGESGGGKTTLFRLLLGLVSPAEGSVTLSPADDPSMEVPIDKNVDLRTLIAYVPQGNSIVSGTIAENMRMLKPDASDEELIAVLKAACAWEFVEKIGLHSHLGERGKGISEGQAQRIAIARALLRNAPVLLLDEATSALDEETEARVLDRILQECPEKTVIVSTHRPSVLKKCRRIYRIQEKKLTI